MLLALSPRQRGCTALRGCRLSHMVSLSFEAKPCADRPSRAAVWPRRNRCLARLGTLAPCAAWKTDFVVTEPEPLDTRCRSAHKPCRPTSSALGAATSSRCPQRPRTSAAPSPTDRTRSGLVPPAAPHVAMIRRWDVSLIESFVTSSMNHAMVTILSAWHLITVRGIA